MWMAYERHYVKRLNVTIIEETTRPRHDCQGHCTGKNGGDGYCYHDDGHRHRVGACRQHAATANVLARPVNPSLQ